MKTLTLAFVLAVLPATASAQTPNHTPATGPFVYANIDNMADGEITGMTPGPWSGVLGWAFDCQTGQTPTSITAMHDQNGVQTPLTVYVIGSQPRPDVQAAYAIACPALTSPNVGVSVYFPQGIPMQTGYGVIRVTYRYTDRSVTVTRMLNFIGR